MRIMEAAEEHLRHQGCEAVDILVLSLRPELPRIYAATATSKPAPRSSTPLARSNPSRVSLYHHV